MENKIEKLKYLFSMAGKKCQNDTELAALAKRIDRLGLYSTILTHGVAFLIYGFAGAIAGSLLGLDPVRAAGAFLLVRLALNYSPTYEDSVTKIAAERKVLTEALKGAPTDPALLSELLGTSKYNPENTPKA